MAMAAAAAGGEMTVISRLERLDLLLLLLEDIKEGRGDRRSSLLSSSFSTASSGREGFVTATDGEHSPESSPSAKKKGCRNMEEVIMETKIKGSLLDRIMSLESRLLQLEVNIESERKGEIEEISSPNNSSEKKKHKGLRRLVKSCVTGKSQD